MAENNALVIVAYTELNCRSVSETVNTRACSEPLEIEYHWMRTLFSVYYPLPMTHASIDRASSDI